MSTTNTFYEERRRDRAVDAELAMERAAAEAEERRRDEAARREQDRRERRERARERERRRAGRREARSALYAKARGEGDTIGAVVAMACAIIPALYFQLRALNGEDLPGVIAVCLAVMLESGAWVATVAGERAKRQGRPVLVFRLVMWGCAAFAGTINFQHAPGRSGGWLAWVLAAASLAGVGFWELRGWGRHTTRAARTKAQRREERRRREHEKARRRRFRDVYRRFEDILAAHPFGSVDRDEAWRTAWHDVHRAPLGLTAEVLACRVEADKRLTEAVEDSEMSPESAAVELLLRDLFDPRGGDDGSAGGAPSTGPDGNPGGDAQGAKSLGRKGERPSGRVSRKTPKRPLEEAHLDKVRGLADLLGGAAALSVSNVGKAIGGGSTEYLIRLRDAVRAERKKGGQ